MAPDQTDRQSTESEFADQEADGSEGQGAQAKPKIQLGNTAPPAQSAYQPTKPDASGNRPKVTMDMLEDESAPGPLSQTLVMGQQDEPDNTGKTGQTLVTGPQRREDKTQPAPIYMSASQVENKPKKHVLLKLVFALFVLALLAGGAFGVYLLFS